jgi:Fe-S-cluster-containing dehydrogenase component/DMSO reductase anchor subunit
MVASPRSIPAGAPKLAQFLGSPPDLSADGSINLIDHFLAEQQSLTAVDRFSTHHEAENLAGKPDQERYYRDLLPLRKPAAGEQFAFEVDLDRCSGCKACVTACHSLNGLDEDETWRHVGLLHDSSQVRMQQNVTTACHHCLEPGCAQGCPTLAYEKDPETGIVRHLDDQCFGCQYCVLKCPYDVPQFNKKKGVVRKCDMCVGRLRAGEAPACAQACPTQAIRIVLVETEAIRRDPDAAFALPGTPDPKYTLPATRYVSKRGLPMAGSGQTTLQPVDAFQIRPEHAHLALVFMLVASQIAAGFWIFHAARTVAEMMLQMAFHQKEVSQGPPHPVFPYLECIGLAGVVGALMLGPLHLGRPLLAWKAFLGWRRSWLSREIIAFNVLAGAATAATLIPLCGWIPNWPHFHPFQHFMPEWLSGFSHPIARIASLCAVVPASLGIVYASAMVYRDTPRPLWATRATLGRFLLSAVVGGGAAYLVAAGWNAVIAVILPPAMLVKLAFEARVLRHRDDEDPNSLWKAAQLMTHRLGTLWRARIALGLLGTALPLLPVTYLEARAVLAFAFLMIVCGELLERYLFFTTGIAPRMPGGR